MRSMTLVWGVISRVIRKIFNDNLFFRRNPYLNILIIADFNVLIILASPETDRKSRKPSDILVKYFQQKSAVFLTVFSVLTAVHQNLDNPDKTKKIDAIVHTKWSDGFPNWP